MSSADLTESVEDSGFKGTVTDNGAKQTLTLQLVFGIGARLDGVGIDMHGEFNVSGTFSDSEVSFVGRYRSGILPARKYTGSRQQDTSITGEAIRESVHQTLRSIPRISELL